MGEAAADPDQLAKYCDELTVDAMYLVRSLSGVQGLMDQYWFSHPEMRTANATGLADAIAAVNGAHDVDQRVGVVGQAFRFAGGTGPMSDAVLAQVMALNPAAHDDAYWKTLEKMGSTGTDAALRDEANRELLDHQLKVLGTEQTIDTNALRAAMKSGDPAAISKAEAALKQVEHQQGILANIQKAIGSQQTQPPHYLLQFDTTGAKGHSIVAVGDPFTAKNVSTIVPGTKSGGGETTTYVTDAEKLYKQMGTTSGTTAVIAWNGYEAPQNIVPEAASPTYAINGAAALSDFEKQLRAANPSARLTVIGHSYGTVEVSYAALRGLPVDNVALIASPAVPPEALAKLEMQGVHLYAARLPFDVISVADHISESIDGVSPAATALVGTDPLNFPGVEHFHTGFARDDKGKIIGGWTDELENPKSYLGGTIHGSYFTTPGSLQNLAAISNGLPVSKPTDYEQRPGEIANTFQHLVGIQIPGLGVPMPDIPGVDWGKVPLPDVHLPDIPLPDVHVPNPSDIHLPHLPDPTDIHLPDVHLPIMPDLPDPF